MTRMARGAAAAAVGFLLALALGACHHSSSTLAVAPAAPTGVVATAGDTQVTLSWGPVKGATGYNLYWSPSPGVTPASGTKIAGVTSPYTQTGLTDGTTYYYVVTAVNAAGESGASIEVNATPQVGLGSTPPPPPAWTWMAGSTTIGAAGVYGTMGSGASGNLPGARYGASAWTDTSGKAWLFGGDGYDSVGSLNYLNDLWKFDGTAWTWVAGSSTVPAYPTYNGLGATGLPGGRLYAASTVDSAGNLWLFGGYGYDGTPSLGVLNDLWVFTPGSGTWVWVAGTSSVNQVASTSGLNATSPSNYPGARDSATLWADASGNIWLFGGNGYPPDGSSSNGGLNDVWEYVSGTGWIWRAGASAANDPGAYGPKGTPSSSYNPSARVAPVSWKDGGTGLWIFGGQRYDGSEKNDLWKFDMSSMAWAWEGGSQSIDVAGVYGTQGAAAPGNLPGGRSGAIGGLDSHGNLWIFGGSGDDDAGTSGYLSDLWKFDGTNWTWVAGSDTANASGIYGTLGTADPGNAPGGRWYAAGWIIPGDLLGVFGGQGYDDGTAGVGSLNDLWSYSPLQ